MRRMIPWLMLSMLLTACSLDLSGLQGFEAAISIAPLPTLIVTASAQTPELLAATPTGAVEPVPTVDAPATAVSELRQKPTATPAPRPPAAPHPTTTASPWPDPVILDFTADQWEVAPGQSVTLSWHSLGGASASLEMETPTVFGFRQDVPASGTLVVGTQATDRHWQRFHLSVYNPGGGAVTSVLTVHLRCPYSFFFAADPGLCPDGPPRSSWAAEQPFEGGRMIWVEDDGGQKRIYVFYADHHYDYLLDTWKPEEPESDPGIEPPAGRLQPVRGFGKLWRSQPQVRERLGWALAPEQGFNTLYQDVSGFEWNNACHYLQTINGSVIGACRRAFDNWFFAAP